MARVLQINISEHKGVIKTPIEKGYFEVEHGLVGDAHAGKWHRQVSLLGQESVNKMTAMGVEGLCGGKFAENLSTEGIELYKLSIGTKLYIGETLMEVTQIGKQCHAGCQIKTQVGDCIMPKEGIFTRVLKAGWIKPGDEIIVLNAD